MRRSLLAACVIGALALSRPGWATDFTYSGGNYVSWNDASRWTPGGGPPRNGNVGIVANSKVPYADANLYTVGVDTPPQEIRLDATGTLAVRIDTLADHRIVLNGGSIGEWWNGLGTPRVCNYPVSVRSSSFLGNGQNDDIRFSGVIQNDGANSGLLTVRSAASPGRVHLAASNTWTGGLQVDGSTVYAEAVGALGANAVTVNGGAVRLQAASAAAAFQANTNGSISVEIDHGGSIVLNGGRLGSGLEGMTWQLDKIFYGTLRVRTNSFVGANTQEKTHLSGSIINDGANTGMLTVPYGLNGSFVYIEGTNNTWTGGIRVENNSTLYASASNCLGTGPVTINGGRLVSGGLMAMAYGCLGSNTVTVNGSAARLQYDSPLATIWANTNATICVEANHGGTLVLNGATIGAGWAGQTWMLDKTFYGAIRVRTNSFVGVNTAEKTRFTGLIQDDGGQKGTLIVTNGANGGTAYFSGIGNTWSGGLRVENNSSCYATTNGCLGTGQVWVNAGTLYIQNGSAMASTAILTVNGGKANLSAGVNQKVAALVLGGVTNDTVGTWGATGSSPAPGHTNDTYLAGSGIVTVMGLAKAPRGTMVVIR